MTGCPSRAVVLAPGADEVEELEASRDDTRLFAIFLDDYHVRRGASIISEEPVPYVAFTTPGSGRPWPTSAACESPIMDTMGTPASPGMDVQVPKIPLEFLRVGSAARGIPNRSSSA